nr:hypothetical protein BN444_02708 [Xanthomonas translucens pv. translucens DSM 18974]
MDLESSGKSDNVVTVEKWRLPYHEGIHLCLGHQEFRRRKIGSSLFLGHIATYAARRPVEVSVNNSFTFAVSP